jgi:hypothetical protein
MAAGIGYRAFICDLCVAEFPKLWAGKDPVEPPPQVEKQKRQTEFAIEHDVPMPEADSN